jgi:hypothetical protein
MNKNTFLLAVLGVLALSTPARADVVWPGLILEMRMLSLWAIAIGLVVEYAFLRWFFRFAVLKSVYVDLCMNAASTVLGCILLLIATIVWEFPSNLFFRPLLGWRIGHAIDMAVACLFAVTINAVLESLVVGFTFKGPVPVGKKGFWVLFAANAISVGLAYASLFFVRPPLR